MTTQADSAHALRKSLDSPALGGQVPDLPEGWGCFVSEPDVGRGIPSHWYATAPYDAYALLIRHGALAGPLCSTVYADSYAELHAKVTEQAECYALFLERSA